VKFVICSRIIWTCAKFLFPYCRTTTWNSYAELADMHLIYGTTQAYCTLQKKCVHKQYFMISNCLYNTPLQAVKFVRSSHSLLSPHPALLWRNSRLGDFMW
ncbi:hypothetical protein L9F63_019476, partial [Diploptera punctata]